MGGRTTYGLQRGSVIREAETEFRQRYLDLREVLAADALAELESHCDTEAVECGAIKYLPTIPRPDKVICVGVNYRPHVEEMGREIPDKPVLFVRFSGSQVGHGQPLIKPNVSQQFDFEGELAVIIGRPARQVPRSEADNYIAGYTCFMDGSVRDWQRHTPQFTAGKNFRKSGAMGPCLVTADEVADVTDLPIGTRVNGVRMQQATLRDLIFDIPYLIEYCSTFADLLPGDVIATGTPGGVGAARTPPRWLVAGDEVSVEIGSIGLLTNPVATE